jgi:hypothetical protein
VIVVDWASIDWEFISAEDSARKSLAQGSQRLWNFYRNQTGGGESNGANSNGGDQ